MIYNIIVFVIVAFYLPATCGTFDANKINILFIAVDDLNDWVTCYQGHPQVKTPNIDRLAEGGIRFTNAHCQTPVCAPSRNSLLTGILPSSSGLYFLKPLDIRKTKSLANAITLPQYFLKHGYKTMAAGKVFHDNDSLSFPDFGGKFKGLGPYPDVKISYPHGSINWDWGAVTFNDSDMPDSKIADWTINKLQQKHDQPFFLSCGFFRPHVPLYASKKWFDLYPLESIELPDVLANDRADISEYAKKLTFAAAAPRHKWMVQKGEWKHAVQAYMASISYVDSCIGRVLDALENSMYSTNTLVVLWSDHGFHLGEKLRWAKRSLWEESTRVPLIIAGPGVPKRSISTKPVGLIDIYPTLIEFCGLPEKSGLDGKSIVPLLQNPTHPWDRPVITTYGPNNHSIRSEDWRYIRYADGSEELYNHQNDPNEWHNIAQDPTYADIIKAHAKWLPKINVRMVSGSADSDSPLYDPNIIFDEN